MVVGGGGAGSVDGRLDGSVFLKTVFILDSSLLPTPLVLSSLASGATCWALETMARR